jgi:hypothetical protein
MYHSKLLFSGIFIWLLFFSGTMAESKKWDFWKEREGIKVYTRINSGSKIKELKMETVFSGSMSSFVAVLQDLSSYERWVYASKDARLIDSISDTEQIYYGVTDFPWPMNDRDYVIHNKIWQNPKTLAFNSLSIAQDGLVPEKDNVVRVSTLRARWTLTPGHKNEINVVYTVKSDPEGSIPVWMTNMMLDLGPFKTLKNLQKEAKKPKYRNAKFDFLKEPDK